MPPPNNNLDHLRRCRAAYAAWKRGVNATAAARDAGITRDQLNSWACRYGHSLHREPQPEPAKGGV